MQYETENLLMYTLASNQYYIKHKRYNKNKLKRHSKYFVRGFHINYKY